MSVEQPNRLREQQLLFANYLRNPEVFAAPAGVEERRLRVYRELFFGNITQLLATTFPVIRSILNDRQWQALVRDFYIIHRCETPLFPFIAREFVEYLLNEHDIDNDYPFLAELAQYEWSEIALRHCEAAVSESVAKSIDIDGVKPVLSPLCWPMVFRFPVHRIGMNFIPLTPSAESTYLLVYRDRHEIVRFIESSAATFRLLQLLDDESLPDLNVVIACIAKEMGRQDAASFHGMIAGVIEDLVNKDILIYRL